MDRTNVVPAAAFAAVFLAARALDAGGVVTVGVTSPQHGAEIHPGAVVEWSIGASASADAGAGIALILADLVQSDSNPEKLDIPTAAGVPAGMEVFSRPLGISNPGEEGLETGYVGVLRGDPGARNLMQIGGAQNTWGTPGSAIGTGTQVTTGIGQEAPVVIAGGSFSAPATPGSYVFLLRNVRANTVDVARAAPAPSPVSSAAILLEAAEFSFTVAGASSCAFGCFIRGDCNGDGVAIGSVTDVISLLTFNFLGGSEPACMAACDINGDGQVAGSVTDAIFMLQFNFLGGPQPPAPFPDCGERSGADLDCAQPPQACR